MRSHLNLEFTRIAQGVRTRQRFIFLAIGALLLITGVALRVTVAVISGLILMGAFASDGQLGSYASAHVRMWQSLHNRPGRGS
jgi:thiamine transporter ThiT